MAGESYNLTRYVVIDKPMLEKLGIDETTELELSTNGDVLVITPTRDAAHERRLKKILEELDAE
jgi:uncharacterized protein YuzE